MKIAIEYCIGHKGPIWRDLNPWIFDTEYPIITNLYSIFILSIHYSCLLQLCQEAGDLEFVLHSDLKEWD